MKKTLNPGTLLAPLPCVLATVSNGTEDNVITIGWTGIINSEPPMTYISVRPSRYSYKLLKASREFVINIPNEDLAFATDYCGCRTGAKENKFEAMHLTKVKANKVGAPLIAECPINLECKVTGVKKLGSHDMFMAEIVAVHVDSKLIDKKGRVAYEKAKLLCYTHGEYFGLNPKTLGFQGYSVMKPKTAKRRKQEGKPSGGKKPHFENKKG